MRDTRETDGPALAVALALVMVLVLVAGGGAFIWQRQRTLVLREEALLQQARAEAEAARANAIAEAQLTQSAGTEIADRPGGITNVNPESSEPAIRAILQAQQRAWNAGEIDQFMESYWKSEDLTFSSRGKLTRTWQGTLDGYHERYPSPRDMGQLSFGNLEVTPLGMDAAFVLGEWQLNRESDELGGNFTLIFRRLDNEWVIVHDHTSRREEP